MESTILVDIDGDSRLMFATNSSGVVLISQFGNIGFSSEEFQYYQCLFKLTDVENIGKLRIGSSSLSSLLWRSRLNRVTIDKLLLLSVNAISPKSRSRANSTVVFIDEKDEKNKDINEIENNTSPLKTEKIDSNTSTSTRTTYNSSNSLDSSLNKDLINNEEKSLNGGSCLSLHQWLLLCKMILFLQLNPEEKADGNLLKNICSTYEQDIQNSKKEKDDNNINTVTTNVSTTNSAPVFDMSENGSNSVSNSKSNGNKSDSKSNSVDGNTAIDNSKNNSHDNKNLQTQSQSQTQTTTTTSQTQTKNISTYGNFANFLLGVPVSCEDISLSARISGWELCTEGFQKPHTKFIISYTCKHEKYERNEKYEKYGEHDKYDSNSACNGCNGNHNNGLNNGFQNGFHDFDGFNGFQNVQEKCCTGKQYRNEQELKGLNSDEIHNGSDICNKKMNNSSASTEGNNSIGTHNTAHTDSHTPIITSTAAVLTSSSDTTIEIPEKDLGLGLGLGLGLSQGEGQGVGVSQGVSVSVAAVSVPVPVPVSVPSKIVANGNSKKGKSKGGSVKKGIPSKSSSSIPIKSTSPVPGPVPVSVPVVVSVIPIPDTLSSSPSSSSSSFSFSSQAPSSSSSSSSSSSPTPFSPYSPWSPQLSLSPNPNPNPNPNDTDNIIIPINGSNGVNGTGDSGVMGTGTGGSGVNSTNMKGINGTGAGIVGVNGIEVMGMIGVGMAGVNLEEVTPVSVQLNGQGGKKLSKEINENNDENGNKNKSRSNSAGDVPTGLNINNDEIPDVGLESPRRYSDFEILVTVLQKLYRGVILPPLPPKNWTTQLQQQTQPLELFAVQRLSELQLFIQSLLKHPIIKHSYELKIFLTTSKIGLNSFRLNFPLFNFDNHGGVIPVGKNKSIVKAGTEFITDATVTARAAAVGIASSIWDLGSSFLYSHYLSSGSQNTGSNLGGVSTACNGSLYSISGRKNSKSSNNICDSVAVRGTGSGSGVGRNNGDLEQSNGIKSTDVSTGGSTGVDRYTGTGGGNIGVSTDGEYVLGYEEDVLCGTGDRDSTDINTETKLNHYNSHTHTPSTGVNGHVQVSTYTGGESSSSVFSKTKIFPPNKTKSERVRDKERGMSLDSGIEDKVSTYRTCVQQANVEKANRAMGSYFASFLTSTSTSTSVGTAVCGPGVVCGTEEEVVLNSNSSNGNASVGLQKNSGNSVSSGIYSNIKDNSSNSYSSGNYSGSSGNSSSDRNSNSGSGSGIGTGSGCGDCVTADVSAMTPHSNNDFIEGDIKTREIRRLSSGSHSELTQSSSGNNGIMSSHSHTTQQQQQQQMIIRNNLESGPRSHQHTQPLHSSDLQLESSLQNILKILQAITTVGDRLDSLMTAGGNELYALSQFGYSLKQSTDILLPGTESLSDTLKLNKTIECVAQSHQSHFDEQHKQVVTPVQFLGRYLQSTNTVILQRAKACSAVEHSLHDEQMKKKALDIARRTKGITEDVLTRCAESLTASEESVVVTRREEQHMAGVVRGEVVALMDIQTLAIQTHLHSLVASRISAHTDCLAAWEELRTSLMEPPMPSFMASSTAWPSGEASGTAQLEDFL